MEVIQSIPRLDAVQDDWNALADRHERPLLRHEWFSSCAKTLHREEGLRVVIVRRGGELVAAAPLVLERGTVGFRLELLGSSVLNEPSGLLFEDEEALDELVRGILRLGFPLQLQRVDTDSPVPRRMRLMIGWRGTAIVLPTAPSFAIRTDGDWQTYYRSLSSGITGNLGRLRRRSERLSGFRVDNLTPCGQEVDALLGELARVEATGWKGRRGSALAAKPKLAAFFRLYARAAAEHGLLRVSVLRLGDRVAAVEFDVEAYRRLWQLKIAYDEALKGHYPGLQLLLESLRHAFDSGLLAFEFLGSAERWEERWNPEARRYVGVLAYPGTFRGVLGWGADLAAAGARRTRRAFERLRHR